MSGSWQERANAWQELKPGDVAAALRDLGAALTALKDVSARVQAVEATVAPLLDQLGTLAGAVAALEDRVAKCEGPTPPVKATKATEAKQAP